MKYFRAKPSAAGCGSTLCGNWCNARNGPSCCPINSDFSGHNWMRQAEFQLRALQFLSRVAHSYLQPIKKGGSLYCDFITQRLIVLLSGGAMQGGGGCYCYYNSSNVLCSSYLHTALCPTGNIDVKPGAQNKLTKHDESQDVKTIDCEPGNHCYR